MFPLGIESHKRGRAMRSASYFSYLNVPTLLRLEKWPGFAYRRRAGSLVTVILSSCSYFWTEKLWPVYFSNVALLTGLTFPL